jgi:CheY-like chemotaxis protein
MRQLLEKSPGFPTYPPRIAMIVESLPATVDSEPSSTFTGATATSPLRVLVVDDGRNAADILALFFEMEGHQVGVAYDGLEAVAQAKLLQPQLILMDIGMPKLDGLEATRRIRSQDGGEHIVIVALSGLDQDDDKRQCAEAGFDDHLAKPVEPNELRLLVDRYRSRFVEIPAG